MQVREVGGLRAGVPILCLICHEEYDYMDRRDLILDQHSYYRSLHEYRPWNCIGACVSARRLKFYAVRDGLYTFELGT